jgi:hypothetical protein
LLLAYILIYSLFSYIGKSTEFILKGTSSRFLIYFCFIIVLQTSRWNFDGNPKRQSGKIYIYTFFIFIYYFVVRFIVRLCEYFKQASSVYNFLYTTKKFFSNVWIGLNDVRLEGSFVWSSSGQNISYKAWFNGQPDNLSNNQVKTIIFNSKLRHLFLNKSLNHLPSS